MTPIMATHSNSTPGTAILKVMLRRLGQQSIYLLTGFPIALMAFILMVSGLSLGVGLMITVVGFPILAGALLLARAFAVVERFRLSNLMEMETPPVPYKRSVPSDGPIKRVLTPLRDPQCWLDAAHAVVGLPLAIVTWTVLVTWWAVAVGGLTWALWGWSLPSGPDNQDLVELLGLGSSFPVRAFFYTAAGALCAISLPWVVMGASRIQAGFSSALLVIPSKHRQEVDNLVAGRDATRAAEENSFRRLERDIHDGPQQRLVRLSMDLGRARKKADGSPELIGAIDDARRQTQDTLDELRALSRGIAPPILADRGLHHAIEDLAARAVIPTECTVELYGRRLETHIESTIYFVVSEALTNAAKHSEATRVGVWVTLVDDGIQATITDDGLGGAHVAKGHGLAGLSDRLRAVDGVLAIDSPTGGPTVIVAEVPCAL